jgi:Xaa-Pro aminopeptidase
MNKLCKHVFVILLIICISYSAYSQNVRMQLRQQSKATVVRPQNPGMRRIQVVKESFLSKQLALTHDQGEKFWPIYRQYQNELFEVRRLKRLNNSDAQANGSEQVKKDLDYDAQLVDIRKHYNDEFMKVLPPEKVSQLIKSEREFNDELVRKLHEQKPGSPM